MVHALSRPSPLTRPATRRGASTKPLGKALEDISDRSRDLIFEMVRSKADDLLSGMEFVNMEPTSMRRQAHPYAEDLINYLRVTFMNLATLPASIREAVHFTCMSHVCTAILEHITGPKVGARWS